MSIGIILNNVTETTRIPSGSKMLIINNEGKVLKAPIQGGGGDALWEPGTAEWSIQSVGTACKARGESSVAEGELSETGVTETIEDWREGKGAHAEGGNTTAAGNYSHTEGNSTVTNNPYEHAEGHFNYSHYSQAVYPNANNTIHSVGIGSNLSNRKNAFEIMQNGYAYLIGVGGYDGTNPSEATTIQDVINQSSPSPSGSGLIEVVKNATLHYEEQKDEEDQPIDEESWFEARIPSSNFPNDFLSSVGKYNLIAVISGEDEGTTLSYTANHFCSQIGSDNSFIALCNDAIDNMDIVHRTSIFKNSEQPAYVIQYTGLLSGSTQLPKDNSKVSIYLQKFY